jgi:hypothetical protein
MNARTLSKTITLLALFWALILGAAQGGNVIPTNTWVDFYSLNSTYLGQPVPAGAYVAIFDPQGVQCAEFTVTTPGRYGIMPCYGDDPSTPGTDEGAVPGDVLQFKINGRVAKTEAIALNGVPVPPTTVVTWISWGNLWQVNLHVLYDVTQHTLDSSANPSVFGQTVVFSSNVSGTTSGGATPTGTVQFKADSVPIGGPVPLVNGSASVSTASLSVGAHVITAEYSGDSNFNPSTAALSPDQVVNQAATTTTITADMPDPSVVGQAVTVSFTVTANPPGSGTPTGNVTVGDGEGHSCTATVAAGSCSLTPTTAGAKTLTATYAGDANFTASADTEAHQVNQAATTTAITADAPDPSVVGQAVTVNFTVSADPPGGGTPTGNVTVGDGEGHSCTATVAVGSCALTPTTAGAKTLTATYAGDSNFAGSSDTEAHQVNQAGTTTTITADAPDPSVVGQAVTVNFTVTANPPGGGTPTGDVTVGDGEGHSCTATVAVGSCALTPTTAGAKTLTATYAGDSNFAGSSDTEAHQVDQAGTTTAITADAPDPSVVGQAVTVNFTVSANPPGGGTPTGDVTVSDGEGHSCTATVAAGSCSLTPTTAGAKTLTATYAGDANFAGSSDTEAHQVNQAGTTTAITADAPDPSAVGQAVTVNFTVSANPPGGGTPTGDVTVSDGEGHSCTATVAVG